MLKDEPELSGKEMHSFYFRKAYEFDSLKSDRITVVFYCWDEIVGTAFGRTMIKVQRRYW